MKKSNNIYEFLANFIKRIFPYTFAINLLFVWGITAIFFYEHFNNFFGNILCIISIAMTVYSHIIAEDYLEKKHYDKDDQN